MTPRSTARSARRATPSELSPYERDLLKGKVYLLIDASETDPVFCLVGIFTDLTTAIQFTGTDPKTWHEVTDFWYEDSDRWRLTPMVPNEQRRWARYEWRLEREAHIRRHREVKRVLTTEDPELVEKLWRYVDGRMGHDLLDLGVNQCPECKDTGWTIKRLPNRMLRIPCPVCEGM